ncbi:Elongation factor G_ mitochondrial [Caligus rogercresseyi]|uniref:Elongation factor G_ mitochondrial n=1 Tax=Caligus rogercresseyi TaxID=217165 RepID=A0A7T8KI93_CALRO|nr:Elongation factor G_ mitochondrial [Caligus rogercresseyi]
MVSRKATLAYPCERDSYTPSPCAEHKSPNGAHPCLMPSSPLYRCRTISRQEKE